MANQNVERPVTGTGGDRANSSQSETFGRSRREFLTTITAFGLASVAPAGELIAQTAASSTKRRLIDVHHHIVPPFFLAENRDRIIAAGGGRINPAYSNWTPEQSLAAMDKQGVDTAVISLSGSAYWFGDSRQRRLRRAE
jgi:6-methylsalicylate decarboxylase